jgi:hypothetical protein
MNQMESQINIKKNPIVIVKSFILLEIIAFAAFFVAAASADYAELYENLKLSSFLPFQLAEFGAIAILETVLVVYIFLRWSFESYDISPASITHEKGIFFKDKTVYRLSPPVSVTYHQSFYSKILKYGTIIIHGQGSREPIMIDHVSTPEKYTELIMVPEVKKNAYVSFESIPDAHKMIGDGERDKLEFKSSLRWDWRAEKVNKSLEKATLKTIAAFMNSGGGHLVIGIDDKGEAVGLEKDYASLAKFGSDGFENHFTNLFNTAIGAEFRRFIRFNFKNLNGKEVCIVDVLASTKPAFVKWEEEEDFYIRTGNSTTALKLSEANSYINAWWRNA